MGFFDYVKTALENIGSAKLRSLLTSLGIIIGRGSVVLISSIGGGVSSTITGAFSGRGSTPLRISSTAPVPDNGDQPRFGRRPPGAGGAPGVAAIGGPLPGPPPPPASSAFTRIASLSRKKRVLVSPIPGQRRCSRMEAAISKSKSASGTMRSMSRVLARWLIARIVSARFHVLSVSGMKKMSSRLSIGHCAVSRKLSDVSRNTRAPCRLHSRRKSWPFS